MSIVSSALNSYRTVVNADVSTQILPNSVDPATAGAIGTDLADTIEPFLEAINNNGLLGGAGLPSDLDGEDLDLYYRNVVNAIEIYRKVDGSWTPQISIPIGISIPDGVLTSLRTTIAGFLVTVAAGSWAISNVIYQKLTQTQFTLTDADLNYTRFDLIYANEDGEILKQDGIASISPAYPATPANCIVVDYAIVSASSSGNAPYLLYGGGTLASEGGSVTKNQDDIYPSSNYILFTDIMGDQIPDNAKYNMELTGSDGIGMELIGSVQRIGGERRIYNLPDGNFTITINYI